MTSPCQEEPYRFKAPSQCTVKSLTCHYGHVRKRTSLAEEVWHGAGAVVAAWNRWAIVKDLDLYYKMLNYIMFNTAGVSHDSQLRATHLIRTVVNSYTNPPTMSQEKGIFHYGQEVLLARWERLQGIFSNSSRFSLQHIETQHCSFFGKKSPPSPGACF